MKSPLTLAGAGAAIFGAAAVFAFHGGFFGIIVVIGGLATMVAGLYKESEMRNAVRAAAVAHIQSAGGQADSPSQRVRRTLSKLRFEDRIEKEASQALAQLDLLDERFRAFETALRTRLNPGEMTYERYLGAGRQVYEVVLGGLSEIAGILPELQAVRASSGTSQRTATPYFPPPSRKQLSSGESAAPVSTEGVAERRLHQLLGGNEKALRELETAQSAVSAWRGGDQGALAPGPQLENSLAELRELVDQAKRYR